MVQVGGTKIGVGFSIFLKAFCNEIISILVLSEPRLAPSESWVQAGSRMKWKSEHQPEPSHSAFDIGDQARRQGGPCLSPAPPWQGPWRPLSFSESGFLPWEARNR